LHTQDTVHLGDTFTLTFNGVKGGKVGGSVYTWRTLYTAKTAFTAEAIEDKMTVAYNGNATFEVIATGERLLYSWKAVEDGAPQITSATNTDTLVVNGNKAGTWHYTCTVWEQNNGDVNYKTITVTLTVEEKVETPADIFIPAHPIPVGTGIAGVDDINNLTVIKGESIVLKPTFTFGKDPADPWHGGKTPVAGTLSYEWQLWVNDPVNGVIIKDLGTGDTLVIDENIHETYNINNVCSFSITLSITNTAIIGDEELTSSNVTGVTINVVSDGSTVEGTVEKNEAVAYSLRSIENPFEDTVVYLMNGETVMYVTNVDAGGNYRFTGVKIGQYTLKVEMPGYDPNYIDEIDVTADGSSIINDPIALNIHICAPKLSGKDHEYYQAANCQDVGHIEYFICECGRYWGKLTEDADDYVELLNGINDTILYPSHKYSSQPEYDLDGNIMNTPRHFAANCHEETTYWYKCSECGSCAGDDPSAVDLYFVGEKGACSFTAEIADDYYYVSGTGTTCTTKKSYYHACEYCYEKGTTTWESNEYGAHDYGAPTYTWSANGSTCTAQRVCSKDNSHVETATATVTSAEKTPASETVMGWTTYTANFTESWATTQTKDIQDIPLLTHTHNYGTTWKTDGTNHWHECSCGDKKDSAAHTGGTATCTAKAKCSVCKAEYGELAEHKYSDATCTSKAKCSVCGDEKGEFAAHTYVDGKCSCGATDPNYTPGGDEPGTDTPGTDVPGNDDPQTPDDNDGLGTGAIVAIVVGSVVVGGAGIFALVWFVIKKKTWAEFLAIFKKG
ncbi:MAG: carboxypeptidase regulatory-like domain-containing protein, partial [Clostridia bacterium]|nr:carboxypeptidase regulatory-like domain-containing protein [Clostridia bacterium]